MFVGTQTWLFSASDHGENMRLCRLYAQVLSAGGSTVLGMGPLVRLPSSGRFTHILIFKEDLLHPSVKQLAVAPTVKLFLYEFVQETLEGKEPTPVLISQ